ncbi:MAG: putative metal-binding motif-containing protein [Deltaproteobacteria bacterium]|nr:putative metal-binding motif-containing protein [Deltaproteobacteria bacterium]
MSRITVALLCLASVFALSGFRDVPADANTDTDVSVAAIDCVTGLWYPDSDGDRYGDPNRAVLTCAPPAGYLRVAGDCDDSQVTVHPDAVEQCNGVDDNCSGEVDETVPTWYRDGDGDGWGVEASTWTRCDQPAGFTTVVGDCNDDNAKVFPRHGCP